MNKNNRKCPYCDYEVTYLEALSDISRGEHTCNNCNQNSNIIFSKKIYISAAILLAIAIALSVIIFLLSGKNNLLLTAVVIIIPFAVFFCLTPMYYRLYPIKNAAITPVVRQKIKSKSRSQITPRAVKYEEKKRLEKEKKIMDKRENSFKSKFSKFVKTYIIVDDDESEKTTDKFSAEDDRDSEKTKIVKAIKDDDLERLKKENIITEESSFNDSDIDTVDPLAEEESFSFVNVYTDSQAYKRVNSREPVYHALNKIRKVDFVYLPELIDVINVDLEAMDEEDEENEEILSFFDNKADDNNTLKKNENFNDIEPEEINSYSTDKLFNYNSEDDKSEGISVNINNDNIIGDEFSAEMINAEIDMAIEAAMGVQEEESLDYNGYQREFTYNSNQDEPEAENEIDFSDDNIKNIGVNETVIEDINGDLEKIVDKSRSFQEELDLSEYKTSSYVENESIDIDLDYNNEEEPDEEFSFEDEQYDVFDESNDELTESSYDDDQTNQNKHTLEESEQIGINSEKEKNKKTGILSSIIDKFIFATEKERENIFEQDERERKLEDKERRRKEKEKDKLRKEKEAKKQKINSDNIDSVNTVTKKKTELDNISHVTLLQSPEKGITEKDYNEQEKIVIESVKDTVAKMEDKKISEEEKIKIISEKKDEEKRREELEKIKEEKEEERRREEKKIKSKKLQIERQRKAEQYRQKQAEKAKASQRKLKESTQERDVSEIKLTELSKVRTKVSQKQEQKRQEVDKFFKD